MRVRSAVPIRASVWPYRIPLTCNVDFPAAQLDQRLAALSDQHNPDCRLRLQGLQAMLNVGFAPQAVQVGRVQMDKLICVHRCRYSAHARSTNNLSWSRCHRQLASTGRRSNRFRASIDIDRQRRRHSRTTCRRRGCLAASNSPTVSCLGRRSMVSITCSTPLADQMPSSIKARSSDCSTRHR